MCQTVVEYIKYYASITPNKVAVVDRNGRTTYSDLWKYIVGFHNYLKRLNIQKGDIVVAQASQNLAYVIAYFSTHLAGGVFSPTEKKISEETLSKLVQQLHAKFMISQCKTVLLDENVKYVSSENILEMSKIWYDTGISLTFPDSDDSSEILFTTGTTGASKGVELSHKSIVAVAENLIYGCKMKSDTVILVPGPLNHANAIRKLFTAMVNGSEIVILDGMVSMKAFFSALDNENVNALCLPPAAIRTLFQLTKKKLGEYANQIEFIESATSPLPESDKQRLCMLLPKSRLYNNYGSSESGSICMYDYNQYPGLCGCIGKAMPNAEIFIVDDNKNAICSSKDKIGLLACKSTVNMKGYIDDPVSTKQVLQNGVVYTNDLGYIDENGFIYIIGRKDDVINVGGRKVAPSEVEEKAMSYQGVTDCICIGITDSITGMALKLMVVWNSENNMSPENLKHYLSRHLEGYKVPKIITEIDNVPRTYNGKIDRKKFSLT